MGDDPRPQADDVGYVCMPLFHSNALMVGWAPSIVHGASVGLARRFTASRWLRRRPPLRRDLLQLHGQAAGLPAGHARAARRRRQPAARRVRQRGLARGRRRASPPLRRRGDRRLRRDRGRRRRRPRRRRACRRARPGRARHQDRRRGRHGEAPGPLRRARPPRERRRVRRRDRQHRRCRPVRGLLQQPRGERAHAALRLVLDRRPRVPRRRRLPLLRRSQRRLDPRRRRELPGGADRGRARAPSRRGRSPPSTACPTTRRATRSMAGLVLREGAGFDPDGFAGGSTRCRDRPEVAAALRAHPARAADHRHEQDREADPRAGRSGAPTSSAATTSSCGSGATTRTGAFTADDERALHESFVHYQRDRFWDL